MSGNVKRKTEIWLIDPSTSSLYRVISDERELVIPIQLNPAVEKFMCINKDEFKDIVGEIIDAKSK
jgi:hypothetical protein